MILNSTQESLFLRQIPLKIKYGSSFEKVPIFSASKAQGFSCMLKITWRVWCFHETHFKEVFSKNVLQRSKCKCLYFCNVLNKSQKLWTQFEVKWKSRFFLLLKYILILFLCLDFLRILIRESVLEIKFCLTT